MIGCSSALLPRPRACGHNCQQKVRLSMTSLRFDDRVAVITGAGRPAPGDIRGLGEAYAVLLAARGAKVVVNDPGVTPDGNNPNASAAETVVREIKNQGGEAVASTHSV